MIGIHQDGFKPALKKRTIDLMFIAKPIGISTVKIMDAFRQVGLIRFYKEMVMIIHEAISVTNHRIFMSISFNLFKNTSLSRESRISSLSGYLGWQYEIW